MKLHSHKTVNSVQPGLRGLMVSVSEVSFAAAGGRLPSEGTLYSDAAWKTFFGADYRKEFSNFVYIGQGEDNREGGTLLFSPNKTALEANTSFRTTTDYHDFHWDPILLALVFIKDPLGRSGSYVTPYGGVGVAFGNRYRVREVYIPGGKRSTLFTTDEFLSPTPFNIPQYEAPIPTSVTYDVPGARGGFPECLHPKIVIPDILSGAVASISGVVSGIGGSLKGQMFPETNVIDWETRVISDIQKLTPSGYHRVRVSVTPPEQPDPIKN